MTEDIKTEERLLDGEQKICLRIVGEEMNADKGYKLDSVLTSLSNFEKLVNKTYVHINGRERFRDNDSENISIRLLEVKEGSFLSELVINYENIILPAVPFIIDNKDFIWGAIKTSYNFIKAKNKAVKEGMNVNVTQGDGVNFSVVNIGDGNVTVNVDSGIVALAEKLTPEFQSITKQIDGTEVSSVEIGEMDEDGIVDNLVLDQSDKALFKTSTFTQDEEVSIKGKIIDGNFAAKNGRMEISDSNDIPSGDYKFSVSEKLHAEDKWRDMFLKERPYYCKKRVMYDPSTNELKLLEIIITDWDEKLWDEVS